MSPGSPPSGKPKLVVIGNGMAPGRALDRLIEAAPDAYDITIFNAEPRVNYDRIMLSPVLSGEKKFEEIVIHGDGWYIKHGVMLYKGHKVTTIDREARTVTSEHGVVAPYDKLIIATGSSPVVIPVPGHQLPGVLAYRDLDDVHAMMLAAARPDARAVVIGGGLLGLEAAVGLKMRGMDVTVLHLMPHLMERQLDGEAAGLLRREIEARGIRVHCQANTKAILGTRKVEGVELADGTVYPAEIVVMAVGIRPNAALAKEAGLAVNRGIVVTPDMRTSDPDIFALGECAEASGQVFGLVAPLYEMAAVVARNLVGGAAQFQPSALATKLKVTGCDLFSAGDFAAGEGREEIVVRDPARGVYKRLVLEGDRLIGAVLYGDVSDGPFFFDLIREAQPVAARRGMLIFGRDYEEEAPLPALSAVAPSAPETSPAAPARACA